MGVVFNLTMKWDDFTIYIGLSYRSGNELGKLTTKIEDENFLCHVCEGN